MFCIPSMGALGIGYIILKACARGNECFSSLTLRTHSVARPTALSAGLRPACARLIPAHAATDS